MQSHEGVHWIAVFRRLAEVDPGRFARLLALAESIVGAHDGHGCDASSEVHAALIASALGNNYQA